MKLLYWFANTLTVPVGETESIPFSAFQELNTSTAIAAQRTGATSSSAVIKQESDMEVVPCKEEESISDANHAMNLRGMSDFISSC